MEGRNAAEPIGYGSVEIDQRLLKMTISASKKSGNWERTRISRSNVSMLRLRTHLVGTYAITRIICHRWTDEVHQRACLDSYKHYQTGWCRSTSAGCAQKVAHGTKIRSQYSHDTVWIANPSRIPAFGGCNSP